jgi:tetratricopeptide (TPR) repeat protein
MNRAIGILFVLLLSMSMGCAGGGKKDVAAGGEAAKPDQRVGEAIEGSADSPEDAFHSGVRSMTNGNYADAIGSLKSATGLKPDYTEAWAALGDAYMKLKDCQNGIAAYRRALEFAPDNPGYIQAIAYGYLYLNNLDKAEDFYLKLVETDTLSYEGNEQLGFIYQKKDDVDYAIKYYRAALRARPADAATMETLAGLYEKKGNEDRRFEYLQKAVEAAPDNCDFRTQLGLAYMKKKDFADAIPLFEGLVKDRPDEAAYHQNLGLALSQTVDRMAEGASELEKTLQLKGDDSYVCGVLARMYNDLKQYDKAVETANRGLAAGGGEESMLDYELGTALSKLGRYDEAIAAFQKAAAGKAPGWADSAKKQIGRQEALKKRGETAKRAE